MSTYPVATLLQKWTRGELTAEQVIGHLLQHVMALTKRIEALERGQP